MLEHINFIVNEAPFAGTSIASMKYPPGYSSHDHYSRSADAPVLCASSMMSKHGLCIYIFSCAGKYTLESYALGVHFEKFTSSK